MRIRNRRLIYILLALMVCLSLIGCAKKSKKAAETTGYDIEIVTLSPTSEAQTTQEATPTTEAATKASETAEPTTQEATTKAQETTIAPTAAPTEAPTTKAPETTAAPTTEAPTTEAPTQAVIDEDGVYTSKEDVALYIHTYNKLPKNYITKKEAEDLGWISSKGNLKKVAPGKSIGGDRFGNYEGKLPKARGRSYTECDIDFDGGYRNSKRIIFSNDGLIFYTEDHYETFEKLY